jgi:hypothetical protein
MKYKRIDNFAKLCFSPVHTWMIIGMCVVLLNMEGTGLVDLVFVCWKHQNNVFAPLGSSAHSSCGQQLLDTIAQGVGKLLLVNFSQILTELAHWYNHRASSSSFWPNRFFSFVVSLRFMKLVAYFVSCWIIHTYRTTIYIHRIGTTYTMARVKLTTAMNEWQQHCGWMMGGHETFFPLCSNSQLNYNHGSYILVTLTLLWPTNPISTYLLTEPSMFPSNHYPPIILPTYLPTYLFTYLPTYQLIYKT